MELLLLLFFFFVSLEIETANFMMFVGLVILYVLPKNISETNWKWQTRLLGPIIFVAVLLLILVLILWINEC